MDLPIIVCTKWAGEMIKNVLLGCLVAFGVFLLFLVIAGFILYKYSLPSRLKMPPKLQSPVVLIGSQFMSKGLFIQDPRLGDVTDIARGEFDQKGGPEIGIVGSRGALFVDESGNVRSSALFGVAANHIDIVDVEGDGICEFMNRGSWSCDASLIDHKGNVIWTYGGGPGVDDMAAGDLDGDGVLEFVVGFNGAGGVHLLSNNGVKKWNQSDGNVWHVEVVDTDGDGLSEIVHSNAGGQITVRDKDGDIISRVDPAPYFSDFSLCRWPTHKAPDFALLSEDDKIWLFDFKGKVVAQFDAPHCGTLGNARGTPVRLKSDEPPYLAVVVEFSNWERSILYVYEASGNLTYQEIIAEGCPSIAALPLHSPTQETLLVGGKDKVWQYKATSSNADNGG